jgi:hypothetical protein
MASRYATATQDRPTPARRKGPKPGRKFAAEVPTISKELKAVIAKMGASNLRVIQDVIGGVEAEIRFDRTGTRYVFRCRRHRHPTDNLRAAQLTIEYLYRALEGLGVEQDEEALEITFDQVFSGFAALPDDTSVKLLMLTDGRRPWWEVLGVERNATKADIRGAYRVLSRQHHPDRGGDVETFKLVKDAYETAMQEAKA